MNNKNQQDATNTDPNAESAPTEETEAKAKATQEAAEPEKDLSPEEAPAQTEDGEATKAGDADSSGEDQPESPAAETVAEEPAKAEEDSPPEPSEEVASQEADPPKAEQETEAAKAEDGGEAAAEVASEPEAAKAEAETKAAPEKDEPEAAKEEAPQEAAEKAEPAKPAKKTAAKAKKAGGEEEEGESAGEEAGEESFEALLEQYDKFRQFRPGDVVEGTVVSIGEQEVLLDIGARVEGMIPTSELKDGEGNLRVSDGDSLTVMVCRFNPDGQYIPLSFERARVSRVWDEIEESSNKEKVIKGTVIEKVKGGFIVDVGVRAFLPTSQASLKPQKDMQNILGKALEFSILKIQRRRGNLILSRRELLQAEYEEMRKELFGKLTEGAELDGVVKNITDYGAFIDLGGLDGLLHITDISWGRVNHPRDVLELNQELRVKVLRFDAEKEKVSLGLKQCTPDPWLSVSEKYPPGTSCQGKVLNLTSYGAFVELEPGVEGMIHVSEMSWTKKIRNPAQVLSKGQEVNVRVLDLDTENRRVSLSLKQTEDNPWESLAKRFPVGSKVTGKVRNITDFGAFVEIEDGIDGLVHVSDFRWGERNANPTDFVKKGEEVEVVILAVDTEHHKVSLGIKQMSADPWIDFTNHHRVGDVVTAPVSKITDFGLFLKLSEHVEGLIRQNELDANRKPDSYKEGEELQATITRISHRDRKVDLSRRKLHQQQERQAVIEYTKKNDDGGATIGDIMGAELKKLMK